MKIEKYISDLLYRYQCVTIPGFGAFLTEFKSAQINTSSNVMSPPKKSLSFNCNLQNNDGLLANHIALEENISYSEAVLNIKIEVDKWLDKLDLDETIVLENIGDLIKNHEGNIMFMPSDNVNYNTDSFGLTEVVTPEVTRETPAFNAPEVKETVISEKFESVFKPETNQKTAVEKLFEPKEVSTNSPLVDTNTEANNTTASKTTKKKKSKVGAFVSVAAVIALLLGGVYGYKMYNDKLVDENTLMVQKNVQEKVEQKIQEATFVMDTPSDPVEVKVENSVTVNEDSNNEVIAETNTTTSSTSTLPYHIIAGSFKSEDNAKNQVKELQKEGFEQASIVGKNSHNLYLVAFNSFSEYQSAINELKNIHQNYNEDAWIFTK